MRAHRGDTDLSEGVIWKTLLRFFIPVAIGMIFQQLYNTVDAVIVGRLVGKEALAAVGSSAAAIMSLFIGLFVGLSSGASVIIAHYYGEKDADGLSRSLHTAIALCLVIGAVFTALGALITEPFLRLIKTPDDIIGYSITYLMICLLGSIPSMLFNMGSAILRALGDSRHPLYYLVFCCCVNIVLDLLFVAVFRMEVMGVAVATVLAQLVSSMLVLRRLCRPDAVCPLRIRSVRFDRAILGRMLRICLPAGTENSMYSVSNLIIQATINNLDTDVIAAWSTTGKLDGIYWALVSSFGVSMLSFVGQNYGARQFGRIRKGVRVCMGMAMGMTVLIATLLLTLGRYCFGIFTDDLGVIESCVEIMSFFVPYYVIWTFIEIISNTLRGMGDALVPMIMSVVGVCGLRILWMLFVVPMRGDLFTICMCYPVTWFTTACAFAAYYLYRKRHGAFGEAEQLRA